MLKGIYESMSMDMKPTHEEILWLIEQAEEVEELRTELVERKKYEAFLRSVIRAGEKVKDEHDFKWFLGKK